MISGNDFSNGSKNTFWASPNMFDKLAVGKLQFVKLLKAVGFVAYGIAKMSLEVLKDICWCCIDVAQHWIADVR